MNSGATEMKFGSHNDGGDDEYRGVGLVEISKIFAMQADFVCWVASFA